MGDPQGSRVMQSPCTLRCYKAIASLWLREKRQAGLQMTLSSRQNLRVAGRSIERKAKVGPRGSLLIKQKERGGCTQPEVCNDFGKQGIEAFSFIGDSFLWSFALR